jgi:hypothetical protein
MEGGRLDVTSFVILQLLLQLLIQLLLQLFLKERAREDTLWLNMVRDRDKRRNLAKMDMTIQVLCNAGNDLRDEKLSASQDGLFH